MLMLLPVPLCNWGYAKVIACTAIALPAVMGFALGAVLAPQGIDFLWRQALAHGGWYLMGLTVAGLHLTVWLSLRLRRGAFALAMLLLFLANMLISMKWLKMPPRMAGMEVLGACMLVGSLMIHPAIARVLRQKAAE